MMDRDEFYQLVEDFYGSKSYTKSKRSDIIEIQCTLYDSFFLVCGIDEDGTFRAGMEIGDTEMLERFLGKRCSTRSDAESIKESLQLIDDYCCLRLPSKYLDEYEKVYASR